MCISSSEIFVHGDLQWDIFQVIISRSTTPDLIKIGMKLQEFFTQQFDTSKRALSTWGPVPYNPPKTRSSTWTKEQLKSVSVLVTILLLKYNFVVNEMTLKTNINVFFSQIWMQLITDIGPVC